MNDYEKSVQLLEQLTDRVEGKLYFNRYLLADSGFVIDIGEDASLTRLGDYHNHKYDVFNGTGVVIYIPAGYDESAYQDAQRDGCGFEAWLTLSTGDFHIDEDCPSPIMCVEINGEVYTMNCLLYLPDLHILADAEINLLKCNVVAELI